VNGIGSRPPFLRPENFQMFLEEGNEPGLRFADRFGLAGN
jgi:hypothetical protein